MVAQQQLLRLQFLEVVVVELAELMMAQSYFLKSRSLKVVAEWAEPTMAQLCLLMPLFQEVEVVE